MEQIEVPELENTPYKFHVYIAHDPRDNVIFEALRNYLEKQNLYVCRDNDPQDIQNGIDLSRRVVFLITDQYLSYEFRQEQVHAAVENADSINKDFIIIVKSGSVPAKEIEDLNLIYGRIIDMPANNDYLESGIEFYVADTFSSASKELQPNFGATMAYSYYYGYLRFVLPNMGARVRDAGFMKGIKDRNQDQNLNERNMSKKLFIIVPESLHGPPHLNHLDEKIEALGKVEYKASRGGHKSRDYSTPVYKISLDNEASSPVSRIPGVPSCPQHYLFLCEIPAILINLYDMYMDGVNINTRRRNREVRQFFYQLQQLLKDDTACCDQYCFIYHRDEDTRNYQQMGDILFNKIKEEIWSEVTDETRMPAVGMESAEQEELNVKTLKVEQTTLKARYYKRPMQYYPIKCHYGKSGSDDRPIPNGKALIISNRQFSMESGLRPRRGTEHDEEQLDKLFRQLNFEVTLFRDQTAQQMHTLANQYARDEAHEDAQAFMCAILTHGESGQLLGVNGEKVPAVRILEIIGQCRTLKGKPKIFFIEACQSAENEPRSPEAGLQCDNREELSTDDLEVRRRLTPCAADILASFSTLPGKRAYRDPNAGTLYIQKLCQIIQDDYKGHDLEEMLKETAESVRENLISRDDRQKGLVVPQQLPFIISTLDKKVALSM